MLSCSIWFCAPIFWMGDGGPESHRVGRVYDLDGTIQTVHTTYAATLRRTSRLQTGYRKPYAAT